MPASVWDRKATPLPILAVHLMPLALPSAGKTTTPLYMRAFRTMEVFIPSPPKFPIRSTRKMRSRLSYIRTLRQPDTSRF